MLAGLFDWIDDGGGNDARASPWQQLDPIDSRHVGLASPGSQHGPSLVKRGATPLMQWLFEQAPDWLANGLGR